MTQKIEQSQRQERVAAWNRRAECDLAAFQNSPKQTYQAEKARDRKLCANLEEAIRRSGLQDGMTVSFHHAFRGGDLTVNMVMDVIAKMGFKNLTLASSSLSDCHAPLVEHIRQGVVTRIYTSGLRGPLAEEISRGLLAEPVQIHSHGGRVHLVQSGELNIDVAFLGVPSCDEFGNANGYTGKACCGSLGYAMVAPLQGAHINVVSGNFIIAQPLGVDDGVDYCHSGRIRRIDEEAIHRQLDSGAIVLMGPVAVSVTGESFNLTSEEIATQLAIKLKAEKMIGFCSSQGVYNKAGEIVSELFPNEAQARVEELEADEDYNSGTVRFLRGAVKACRSGVRRCHLISYQENGALLQELFSRDGIGTQIVMESAEQIRRATINDIGGILELISPLEQQGILVRRSREQLEMEIDKFTIIQRDNTTIACAALYPFPEEKIGEMACVAVHPDYRSSSRGEVLLERIAAQARQMGLSKLFVLTTRSIHWFQERGFTPVDIDLLPESKKQMYNYQRRSKVLMADLA